MFGGTMLRRCIPVALLSTLSACGGGDDLDSHTLVVPGGRASAGNPGDVFDHHAPGPNESRQFIVDPNQGGGASELFLSSIAYGRLVDVYGLSSDGRRLFQQRDFAIAPDLASDGVDYLLETQPATGQTDLVILRDTDDLTAGGGKEQFLDLLKGAEAGLVPLVDVGLPGGSGFWSLWPRDGALVLRFDDLLDAATISAHTLHLLVGDLPVVPFEVRVLADQNHGDWALLAGSSERAFFTTRVVLDVAISEFDAAGGQVPVNWLGLPPGSDVTRSNVALRVPTQEDPPSGQTVILRNPSGAPVASVGNGTVDLASPTRDLVRAARSGGPTAITGDPYEGFLADEHPPVLIGHTPVTIHAAPLPNPLGDGAEFEIPLMSFDAPSCAESPRPGAALVQPGFLAVVSGLSPPPLGGSVQRVRVRLLRGNPDLWPAAAVGPATWVTPYDPLANAGQEACFLRLTPRAAGWPHTPARGVDPSSAVGLTFSEPVGAGSLALSDALYLARVEPDQVGSGYDLVPADVTSDGRALTLHPLLPLTHRLGVAESYWLGGPHGSAPPRDKVGNALDPPLPPIELRLDPAASDQLSGGHVTRFATLDEDPPSGGPFGPMPEWSGQHVLDLTRQEIRPRPVVRFEAVIDRNVPVPQLMTPFPPGVGTPLSNLGAKAQLIWRYVDVGFGLQGALEYNLDLEGLAWAPLGGAAIADSFDEFEIALSHAEHLPDEYIDPWSLFPAYPYSGLERVFAANLLNPDSDPLRVVHPRGRGYFVNPGDLYSSPSGTPLMPFPWNMGLPPDEWTYYTWRDTALRRRGGSSGDGVPLHQERVAQGLPQANRYYRGGEVRAEALPLLMEFRCWPDGSAIGLNSFDVSLAANSSSRPFFRAFSAGGVDQSGSTVLVDPDLETQANGGFDHLGQPTWGLDNVSYLGSMDFVVRVSRSYSLWFEARDPVTGAALDDPTFSGPLLEPTPAQQPEGTRLELAYRGMESFAPTDDSCGGTANNFDPLENALTLDMFGDHYDDNCFTQELPDHNPERENVGITFQGGTSRWLEHLTAIDGASYYQIRVTFEADPTSGVTPTLATFGMGWSE